MGPAFPARGLCRALLGCPGTIPEWLRPVVVARSVAPGFGPLLRLPNRRRFVGRRAGRNGNVVWLVLVAERVFKTTGWTSESARELVGRAVWLPVTRHLCRLSVGNH